MHTRLIDEVEEWKIQRTLQLVREMGVNTIVEFFPWAYIERSPDQYDWSSVDRIVRHARNQGIHIIARMGLVPGWARQTPDDPRAERSTLNTLPLDSFDDFAQFAADFAARYAGTIDQLIIWNEPNLAFEWGRRPPDPQAYAELLKVVYPRVKAAVPDAIVLAGALSPGASLGDGRDRLGDLEYTQQLYAAGAAPYFDMWAVHAYGARVSYDDPPYPEEVNFRRTEINHELIAALGDRNKPLIITEGGWNDNLRWSAAVRPADRLRWTIGAYRQSQEWNWLEATCIWQFSTPWQARTYQDNWNFVAADGTPKAIYWAVREAFVPGADNRP